MIKDVFTLTEAQARAIQEERYQGASLKDIAPRFGVSYHTLGTTLRKMGFIGYDRPCVVCGQAFNTPYQHAKCCPNPKCKKEWAKRSAETHQQRHRTRPRGPRMKGQPVKEVTCLGQDCGARFLSPLDRDNYPLYHFCDRCRHNRGDAEHQPTDAFGY